jgi:membrane protein DedA with SNARE-associated domain/rhodanese-related sulfurtransferase
METWLAGIAQHGYLILFLVAFLETLGFPFPAALALMLAGAASARGMMNEWLALFGAIAVIGTGDVLMYLMGRFTGWWLLSLLCRLSLNPESCILRSADAFYRRGKTLLVFAKFVPGINTMAPPLAGSMNMRFAQFFRLDAAGATLYASAYFLLGFLFSDAVEPITRGYKAFGHALTILLVVAAVAYISVRIWYWRRSKQWRKGPTVEPAEAARELAAGNAVVYDVRSHGYYQPKSQRILGSRRLDPNGLNQDEPAFPPQKHVYVYCTCLREATSARVAHVLRERGIMSWAIRGGLTAWKKAGLPVEQIPAEELATLPVFGD